MSRQNVRQLLTGLSAKQRANVKAQEIAKRFEAGSFTRNGITIDVLSINTIEGGVEVFARAWRNGKQLGFGKDGSVDIERFRFFNPPVLVPDDDGDIVLESVDINGETTTRTMREDPLLALRQSVAEIASMVGKDNGRIRKGKIGRTTTTVYPDADPETTTVDGHIRNHVTFETGWAACRSASSGSLTQDSLDQFYSVAEREEGIGFYRIYRGVMLFDTSSVPETDEISEATLTLTAFAKNTDYADAVRIVTSNPASNTALSSGDFDIAKFGSTALANDIATSAINASGANVFTFNSSGIAAIVKGGITKLGVRQVADVENNTPTHNNLVAFRAAERSGTTEDPKLVIVHELAEQIEEASLSPVLLEVTVPSVTATAHFTAAVAAVALAIAIPSVTATYVEVATASVDPVALSVSIPEVTATAHFTAAVQPVGLELSIPSVSASYVQEETASVSPVGLTVAVPSVTADYEAVLTADVSPVVLNVSIPSVTAQNVAIAEVEPVALEIIVPPVTATFHATASVGPVGLVLSIPSVTAINLATASVSPVELEVSVPEVTATYEAVLSAQVAPVVLHVGIPPVMAENVATANVAPIALILSVPSVTATYEAVLEAAVEPVALELSVPEVTAINVAIGEVEPILLSISIPTVTAEHDQGTTASVSPVVLHVGVPSVTATFHAQASVSPVVLSVSVPTVAATFHATADVQSVQLEITVPSVTATHAAVFTADVSPVALSITVPSVTAEATIISSQHTIPLTGFISDRTALIGTVRDLHILTGSLTDQSSLSGELSDRTVLNGALTDFSAIMGTI